MVEILKTVFLIVICLSMAVTLLASSIIIASLTVDEIKTRWEDFQLGRKLSKRFKQRMQ